ncbi:MAG: S8 family serine peptidase, partial [Bacilli bacterium]
MYQFKKRSVWKKIQLLSLSFFVGLLLVATSYPASIFLDFSKEDNTMTLNEDEYLEGEILIKYRKNGFRMMVSELDLTQTGVKGVRKIDFDFEPRVSPLVSLAYVDQYEWYHGKLEDGVSVEDAINNLKDQKNVIVAEPVYIRTTSDIEESVEEVMSNDPLLSQQTYLEEVKIKEAREFLQSKGVNPGGSRDVIVAVIDTGVDYEHEDLKANMWVNSGEIPNNGIDDDNNGIIDDVHGASFIGSSYSYNGDPKDLYGHGTHVAGIIAAQGNNNIGIMGVAPNVRIMAIRAGDASGVFTTYSIAEAINYASKMGADVINMSFGGMMKSKIEEDALQLAYNTSVLVAAAGNNSRVNLPGPGEDFFPAAYPWVIGVMASDGNRTAAFSNYDYKPMDNHEYEVTAPGVNILSTLPNNKYAKWSGTSMAAPIVSGIAALVRSYYTDRTEYTSRFIMGQIVETGPKSVVPSMLSIWDTNYPKVDGYAALTVLPEPNLFVFDYFIFDDKSISPLNDGDGVLDAGETAYIGIIVKNRWGKAIDVNVSLDLTTNGGVANPYIEVTKNNLKYGDIGYFGEVGNGLKYKDGAIVGLTDPFIIKVDPSTPNDIIHTFNVTITCKNGMDLEDDKVYIFDNNTSPSNKFSLATRNGVELPSVIREDMVLTNDKYWIIPNSTKILDGVTVTVEEGTQIQFWSSDPEDVYAQNSIVTLIVKGRFITNGTPEKPVKLFPSGLMPQHSVKIESNQNNNVILNHTEVINPQIQIDYAYNSYFYQNGDYMYSRYLSDGNVYDDYTQPYIYAHEINNSILYNLGYVYLYYTQRLRIEGKLYGNLFNSCFTELNFNSIKDAERNVFLNNYKIDRYDNILPSSIKGIYESTSLTVNEYVKNNKDGTIYISVRAQDYGIASRFAKYLGGYIASINNEEEMNFIRQNHNKLANYDYMVLGYKYQSETNSYMWEDGSPIEYTNWYPNVANKVMGYYKLVADSNGKWQTYNTQWSSSLYYLIEIPSQNLIEDFDFVENEIIIDDQTLDYQVDIILNPVTSSYSDLVFRSTNEEIFKVSSDG